MAQTIARSLNNAFAVVVGGLNAEARADQKALERIKHDGAQDLQKALKKGDEIKMPKGRDIEDADDQLASLELDADTVSRYVPDFKIFSEAIADHESAKLPDFLKEDEVDTFISKARATARRMSMNKGAKSSLDGLRGVIKEDLQNIAKEMEVTDRMHLSAFLWAYEGVTISDDRMMQAQIHRRVRKVAKTFEACVARTRIELIKHVWNAYMARKQEDLKVEEVTNKRRHMNPGQRSSTFEGRVERMAQDAASVAAKELRKEFTGGAEDMAASLSKMLPKILAEVMAAMAREEEKVVADKDFHEVNMNG